ncbi:hypothetical protein AB0M48_12700 [Lentzea sp. NPDC051208]|uniref:hypothetical protein n=1 Tax=Lentzea sp. NPDC051208 TaxID=3154642 RepID=UPI003448D4BA
MATPLRHQATFGAGPSPDSSSPQRSDQHPLSPPPKRKVSLYQLTGRGDLGERVALKAREEDHEFNIDGGVRVDDRPACWCTAGPSRRRSAGTQWSGRSSELIPPTSAGAAAAMAVDIDEVIYVVTFNVRSGAEVQPIVSTVFH